MNTFYIRIVTCKILYILWYVKYYVYCVFVNAFKNIYISRSVRVLRRFWILVFHKSYSAEAQLHIGICSVTDNETWPFPWNKSSLSLRSERKASSSFALFRSRCSGKCKEIHAGIFPRLVNLLTFHATKFNEK